MAIQAHWMKDLNQHGSNMKKVFVFAIVFVQTLACVSQSVIHYVSYNGEVSKPMPDSFYDENGSALTVTSNTYTDGIGTITLSGNVTKFANGALYDMDLLYVTVPATVTKIGKKAFSSCTNLQAILFEPTSVPTGDGDESYAFSSTNMTIYAPLESWSTYNTTFISMTAVTLVCSWQDITLNSSSIATFGDTAKDWLFYSDYEHNSGLKAYKCTAKNETTVAFTPTNIVYHGQGAVLKDSANGTYRLLESKPQSDSPATNYMVAATGETISDANGKYILYNGNKGIGFYPLQSGTAISTGKAYLDLGSGSGIKDFISLDNLEETSYIPEIPNNIEQHPTIAFDLSGRPIRQAPPASIIIINGKKYYKP